MSGPGASLQELRRDVEALLAAVLVGAPLQQITPIADRIAAAVTHAAGIPTGALGQLRLAIDLLTRRGSACATTSALLIARSQLVERPQMTWHQPRPGQRGGEDTVGN